MRLHFLPSTLLALGLLATPAAAQVSADGTVGTVVTPAGTTFTITGGTTAGTNLFHSFSQFSVPTGGTAFFDNTTNIANIFSRVTGGSASNIDGLLRANGTANLFLLNPAGIFFNENASLNIGGSFLATTADSIVFQDGVEFSATNPNTSPLLTVSVPVGLQMGANPEAIINRSVVTNTNGKTVGLEVSSGQTIALIGGAIALEEGYLSAPNGHIELGAGRNATANIVNTNGIWRGNYPASFTRGNITLSNRATINTSGQGGGSIHLFGGDVRLIERSQILADTLGNLDGTGITINARNLDIVDGSTVASSVFGSGAGGHVNFQVSESLQVSGVLDNPSAFQIAITLASSGQPLKQVRAIFGGIYTGQEFRTEGVSGNIEISAKQVRLNRGSSILARGGRISIEVDDIFELSNSVLNNSVISNRQGGNVEIRARQLIGRENAFISNTIFPGNTGRSGDILIRADRVEWSNTVANAVFPAAITTGTLGVGQGGSIIIDTKQLALRNGARVSTGSGFLLPDGTILPGGTTGNIEIRASESVDIVGESPDSRMPSNISTSTFSNNGGGNIAIQTAQLRISGGGGIASETFGLGPGGAITIEASEVVELQEAIAPSNALTLSPATISSQAGNLDLGLLNTGDAGSINISTPHLRLNNGATISVSSVGTGNSGNISLAVDTLQLQNKSQLSASAASGEGGNILLNVANLLLLREGSSILAEAGGSGNGGNIDINAGVLVGVPGENSDITANAFAGNGGNIQIATNGIFGLQFRPQLTPLSDITASSQLGVSGTVNISEFITDPSNGVIELSTALTDASQNVVSGCAAALGGNSFTVTGRGGLPTNPSNTLVGDRPWSDVRDLSAFREGEKTEVARQNVPEQIVEANSWRRTARGNIELIATGSSSSVSTNDLRCDGRPAKS